MRDQAAPKTITRQEGNILQRYTTCKSHEGAVIWGGCYFVPLTVTERERTC